MATERKDVAVALVGGLLFGAGLVVSGMTDPTKVINFLDVLNNWDPTLAFVLAGATGTHMVLRPLVKRRFPQQVTAGTPTRRDIDRPLLVGAALFGAGWGLGGYCPGPALTAGLPALGTTALFVLAMLGGMAGHRLFTDWQAARAPLAGGGARASAHARDGGDDGDCGCDAPQSGAA